MSANPKYRSEVREQLRKCENEVLKLMTMFKKEGFDNYAYVSYKAYENIKDISVNWIRYDDSLTLNKI